MYAREVLGVPLGVLLDTTRRGEVEKVARPFSLRLAGTLIRMSSSNRCSDDDDDGWLTEDGRLVGHALRRLVAVDLAGLFDGPSTVWFDPSLPMISLDLSRVTRNRGARTQSTHLAGADRPNFSVDR